MNEHKCQRYHIFSVSSDKCMYCGVSFPTDSHQSEKPQPEQWFKELEIYKKSATEAIMTFDPRHTFCTVCGTDPEALVARLNEVVASLLLAQKEQMLEGVRGMERRTTLTKDDGTLFEVLSPMQKVGVLCDLSYNYALEDVEEKWKKL